LAVTMLTAPLWAARAPEAGSGIVFQAKVHGSYELFTIDPDGTDLRQITRLGGRGGAVAGAELPAWSPDGKNIVFDSGYARTRRGAVALFTIRPDGDGLTRVPLAAGVSAGAPAFAPDGKTISFDWSATASPGRERGINLVGANGRDVRRLVVQARKSILDGRSDWSPDGRWIAFTELRGAAKGTIEKIRPDGTGRRALTPAALDANNAAWSPNGRRIAFNSHNTAVPGASANIYVVGADGRHLRPLTHYRGGRLNAYMCDWSPDGRHIVFHVRGAGPTGAGPNQLFVMDATGRHVRQLTHLSRGSNPSYASWSPAG